MTTDDNILNLFDDTDENRDIFSFKMLASIFVLTVTISFPFFLTIFLCSRFSKLDNKDSRKKMSGLLSSMDSGSRCRLLLPVIFFARRLVTAIFLVLSSFNLVGAGV